MGKDSFLSDEKIGKSFAERRMVCLCEWKRKVTIAPSETSSPVFCPAHALTHNSCIS
jgi:hypothetical protein